MAKVNLNNPMDEKNGMSQGRMDRIMSLIGKAVNSINILSDSFDSGSNAVVKIKKANTDNAIKVTEAETEVKKEENRHKEAMANMELEYKKLSEAYAKGELKLSLVHDIVRTITAESNKFRDMDDATFLSDEARTSRDDLHRAMIELTKEILRS